MITQEIKLTKLLSIEEICYIIPQVIVPRKQKMDIFFHESYFKNDFNNMFQNVVILGYSIV